MSKIHFMGIGGSGMSAVAEIARSMGFQVSGCDLKTGGHDVSHLEGIDILAVTPAVYFLSKQHPELVEGQHLGIAMTWQEFMGKYLHKDKFVICIAGTHGKSTTTALAGLLLQASGLDPTVEVGADGSRFGQGKYFISEADEYYGNFLHYHPNIVILNNIELDHPEYFGTFEKMLDTYAQFVSQIKPGGTLIYNMDNLGNRQLIPKIQSSKISIVGFLLSDFPKKLRLSVPGNHNKANAVGIIKLAEVLKISNKILY
ncbi:MAG: Mur ligase family protein, partial [Patescibacteria group bacterium]